MVNNTTCHIYLGRPQEQRNLYRLNLRIGSGTNGLISGTLFNLFKLYLESGNNDTFLLGSGENPSGAMFKAPNTGQGT